MYLAQKTWLASPNDMGMGEYDQVKNWSREFWPPPYDFLAPPATISPRGIVAPEDVLQEGASGLGCGCGCSGSGGCRTGMGLFDTTDFSQWGIGEWVTIAAGLYLTMKLVGDTRRVAGAVRRRRRRKSRA